MEATTIESGTIPKAGIPESQLSGAQPEPEAAPEAAVEPEAAAVEPEAAAPEVEPEAAIEPEAARPGRVRLETFEMLRSKIRR